MLVADKEQAGTIREEQPTPEEQEVPQKCHACECVKGSGIDLSSLGELEAWITQFSSVGGGPSLACWVSDPSLKLYFRELLENASSSAKFEKL